MGVDHAEAYDGTSSTATHGSLVELLDKNDSFWQTTQTAQIRASVGTLCSCGRRLKAGLVCSFSQCRSLDRILDHSVQSRQRGTVNTDYEFVIVLQTGNGYAQTDEMCAHIHYLPADSGLATFIMGECKRAVRARRRRFQRGSYRCGRCPCAPS